MADNIYDLNSTPLPQASWQVRLKAEDWTSGETYWLLDVIAPSQKVATAVLANFK